MAGLNLIIDTPAVRERMSLQDLDDINNAIDSGLNAAHAYFEGVLNTQFSPITNQTDVFFVNSNLVPAVGGMYKLGCKRMFLSGTPVVKWATTRKQLLDGVSAEVVPAEDYTIDMQKGLLYIEAGEASDRLTQRDNGYADVYVSITYNAGFDTSNAAPDWLKEAVLAYMPSVLISEDEKNKLESLVSVRRMAAEMTSPYQRNSGFIISPVY